MWTSRKPVVAPAAPGQSTKRRGDAAEDAALEHLQRHGLRLVQRNFRTPGRGGGEVDLIMREPDGTLVFVEVRQRASARHGGAGASITTSKRRRLVLAARHYLMRQPEALCRFDCVLMTALSATGIEWIKNAFSADDI
jgi:putative endonuclease